VSNLLKHFLRVRLNSLSWKVNIQKHISSGYHLHRRSFLFFCFRVASCPLDSQKKVALGMESVISSIVWLFEFLNNHQFWYFKYFKMKEPSIPILWKKSNKKIVNFNYFQNLKELMLFMKESIKGQWFYGWSFDFWESWLYTKIKSLIFFENHDYQS
jgi:hypothetical protein